MVTRAHLHFFEIVKYWKNCYDNSIAVLRSYPLVRKLIDRWNTGGPIFFLFSVRYNDQVIGLPRLNTIFGSTTAIVTKYIFLFVWKLLRQIFNHNNYLSWPPNQDYTMILWPWWPGMDNPFRAHRSKSSAKVS